MFFTLDAHGSAETVLRESGGKPFGNHLGRIPYKGRNKE